MKYILLLLLPVFANAQKRMDKKIIITLADTSDIYNKVKLAMVKNDFIVKEDGDANLITTYPRSFKKLNGYSVAKAELIGSQVFLSGVYGLTYVDYVGYDNMPTKYKHIVYYEKSHGWKLLMQVASLIGTQITYSK